MGIVTPSNATSMAVAAKLAGVMTSPAAIASFFSNVPGGVTVTSSPSVVMEPGDVIVANAGPDPSGMALLPGDTRLLPAWKVKRWSAIKAKWQNTVHKYKQIPIHDIDPSTLPCLLAADIDTVPLMRAASVNCDGTIPRRGDGKPRRRWAEADVNVKRKTSNQEADKAWTAGSSK